MKLTESDRLLFRDASRAVQDANTVMRFVSQHLGRVYKIPNGAQINPETGEIIEPTEGS